MNKFCRIFFYLLIVLLFYTIASNSVLAAKKDSLSIQVFKVYSNKGESTIYGSVLNPKEDEINVRLPKSTIEKFRQVKLDKLTCSITSKLDSTKTYSIPENSISIQKKKIKNISGKYLVISLFNLTTPSGITISPSSLPNDDYIIKILGDNVDLTTDSFNYKTPALVVGTVDSKVAALVTIEDLNGNKISDNTVAADPNGTFFTEVRADKIGSQTKARKYLKAQTVEDGSTKEIDTALVHCVTDTDLYAITFLDPDKNGDITNQDLIVDEDSTLTANLAMENEELAFEVANDQLQGLDNGANDNTGGNTDNGNSSATGCNIDKFASRCTSDNESIFTPIGKDFKDFLEDAECDFPQFDLIKKIILASPDDQNVLIGKAYCEHYTREVNNDKSCQAYAEILSDYKVGKIKNLPCPPSSCKELQNKSLKCSDGSGFCEDSNVTNNCVHKPVKDLYCSRIGIDIHAEDCSDDNFSGLEFKPGWKVVKNSKGNEYCVPSNFSKSTPSTPEEIAEQCEISACHRECEEKFGFNTTSVETNLSKCDVCDCHFVCDAEAGRVVDCENPSSKYFSIKCCKQGISTSSSDSRNCLCKDQINNFDDKGFVKPEAQSICKKKCPEGFVSDGSGGCACPAGQTKDPVSGKCVTESQCGSNLLSNPNNNGEAQCICPDGLKFWNGTACVSSCPNGLVPSPALPSKSPQPCVTSGTRICLNGEYPKANNCTCASPAVASGANGNGPCQCPANYNGPYTTNGCGTLTTQSCPAPYITNLNGNPPCKCPEATPINFGATCVAKCPEGLTAGYPQTSGTTASNYAPQLACQCPDKSYPDQNGTCTSSTNYCSPGISTSTGCTCNPAGGAYALNGYCVCTTSAPYTKESGCNSPSSSCPSPYIKDPTFPTQCACPESVPYEFGTTCVSVCPSNLVASTAPATSNSSSRKVCKCSDGSYPNSNGICSGSTAQTCSSPYVNNLAYNSSNSGYTPPCKCPDGKYYYNNDCVAACPGSLVVGTPLTGPAGPIPSCLCAGTLQNPGSDGQCSDTSTANYCSPGISTSTGCTCNPAGGAYPNNGNCVCPTSASYTKETGCNAPHTCVSGEISTAASPCTCASGATLGSGGSCQCANGQSYTVSGCSGGITCTSTKVLDPATNTCKCPTNQYQDPSNPDYCKCTINGMYPEVNTGCPTTARTCYRGETYSSSNPCQCGTGASFSSANVCQCPSGQLYATLTSGTSCINNPTINFSSAVLIDDKMKITHSSSEGTLCYDLFKGSSTVSYFTVCTNGTNDLTLAAIASNGGTTKFGVGDSFKLCLSIDRTICSNTITATDGCTEGKVFNALTSKCE